MKRNADRIQQECRGRIGGSADDAFRFVAGQPSRIIGADRRPCAYRKAAEHSEQDGAATVWRQAEQPRKQTRDRAEQKPTDAARDNQLRQNQKRKERRNYGYRAKAQTRGDVFDGNVGIAQNQKEAEQGEKAEAKLPRSALPQRSRMRICHGNVLPRIKFRILRLHS